MMATEKFKAFVAGAALTLQSLAQGDEGETLKEAVAEINATFAKARCPELRVEVPNTAYTFEAMLHTRVVRFVRTDPEGATNRRSETIEVSVYRLNANMAMMKGPRPGKDPEFFLDLGCTGFGSHCIIVVETQGRIIKGQRAVRGKSLPLCGLTKSETTRLVGRIGDVAARVRADRAAQ